MVAVVAAYATATTYSLIASAGAGGLLPYKAHSISMIQALMASPNSSIYSLVSESVDGANVSVIGGAEIAGSASGMRCVMSG